jgi:hypothetical protein
MLIHYYHVYCEKSIWKDIALEHIQALHESGLFTVLDAKRVGIVGRPSKREEARDFFVKLGFEVFAEADRGYEQVTLNAMKWEEGDKILYTHTKGSYDRSQFRDDWRKAMNACVITRWRRCVEALEDGCDAAGSYWYHFRPRADNTFITPKHFAGNFFWVTGEYLNEVPFPIPDESRWDAEFIPFQNVKKVLDLHTGPPVRSNWAHRRFTSPPPPGYVRFVCFARVLNFSPGHTYEIPNTPLIQKILDNGVNLQYLPFRDEEFERIFIY